MWAIYGTQLDFYEGKNLAYWSFCRNLLNLINNYNLKTLFLVELIGGISSRKIDCFVVICQSGHWCRRTDEPVDGPNASHI